MRYLAILFLLLGINSFSQDAIGLRAKLDTVSGKYGYVNEKGDFIIKPQYSLARNFMSEYTSVQVDTLWGIIDTSGNFYIKPKFRNEISAIYRNHFLEYGENMKFRNIDGTIKYEYLFIPGPFNEIELAKDTLDRTRMQDIDLMLRVLEMYKGRWCHYYEKNRVYNMIAIGNEWAAMESIKFVLDNPAKVKDWIEKDMQFEEDFENGKIDCCGHGHIYYRD